MRFATKLALLLVVTLAGIQAATGAAVYELIRATLIRDGKAQLTVAARQFVQQLGEVEDQVAAGVNVLTLDFALRQAIAEHEHGTVVSALRNHGGRIGASRMTLIETDGRISESIALGTAGGRAAAPEAAAFAGPAVLEQAADQGRVATVTAVDGLPAWLVVVPVLAPDPIAFVAAFVPLDDARMERLRATAGLPAATGLAVAVPGGGWQAAAGPVGGLLADALAGTRASVQGAGPAALPSGPVLLRSGGGEVIFLAAALDVMPDTPAVTVVMGYPLSEALWRYGPLAAVLLAALAAGLAAALAGTTLIARGVSRPLERLARYAGRIEAGDYTPPPGLALDGTQGGPGHKAGRDEIGQLGAALVRMTGAISEREARIRHQASHEPVTGLPNRQALAALIDAGLAGGQEGGQAVVLVVTLVRLQEIVNTVGRDVADRLMRDAAGRLRQALGAAPVGCIGERSFAALLPGCGAAEGEAAAARVLDAFEAPYREGGLTIDAGATAGLALSPAHGTAASPLMRRAEVAQQAALGARTRVATYQPGTDPHRPERLSLMGELREGLPRGEFELLYQPKLDLRTGLVGAAEALVRWNHPARGLVRPDDFIGLAEETGNIGHLTRWALDAGVAQAAQWQRGGMPVRVAVNLSARDLGDAALPGYVEGLLRRHGADAGALGLEVTESAIMDEPDAAIQVLHRLADLGIPLSIDDFGAGQSSLAYLRRLPARELKIDKAFVLKLGQSTDDRTIVGAVVGLGHSLGYAVTAEGVEDEPSLCALEDLGCDHAQGYFIARPLAPAAFDGFLQDWNSPRRVRDRAPQGRTAPCPAS